MSHPVFQFFQTQVDSYSSHFGGHRTGNSFCFRRRLTLARELNRQGEGTLLDCATGSGEITTAILRSGRFAAAELVDISSNMLARAREAAASAAPQTRCTFEVSDIFDYLARAADEGRSYGLVLCLGLIAHTGRLDELLALVRKCLTPGKGRLLLQSTLLDHPGTRLVRLLTRCRYQRRHGYAISYFRLSELRNAVQRSGMRVVEERRFGLCVPFGDHLWRVGNYYAERLAQRWVARHGAEILLAIECDG